MILYSNSYSQNISGIINNYSPVTTLGPCNSVIVTSPSFFAVGDKVLIIQMKGATLDTSKTSSFGQILSYNEAGKHELNIISAINGFGITLQNILLNNYDFVSGAVQMVRVPVYTNATITGSLLASPWNGASGGIIALEVTGTLTVNADIVNSSNGFLGGNSNNGPPGVFPYNATYDTSSVIYDQAGLKGEGIAITIPARNAARGRWGNGGGGGNMGNCGGGGGSNYGAGGLGGNAFSNVVTHGGLGGQAMTVSGRLFLGGGGGGGESSGNNGTYPNSGTPGGVGGGIIFIKAGTLTSNSVNRKILTNGAIAAAAAPDGAGGGGGGGTIILDINTYTNCNFTLEAKGGKGGNNTWNTCHPPGGGGGGGAIYYKNTLPAGTQSVLAGANGTCINNGNLANGALAGGIGIVTTGLIAVANIPFVPVSAFAGNDVTKCLVDSIELNGTGSGAYSWSPSTGLSNPDIANPKTGINVTTDYILTVTQGNCLDRDTVRITVNNPSVGAGSDDTMCLGIPVTLSGSGTGQLLWSPSASLNDPALPNPVASPGTTTQYVLRVDDGVCVNYDTLILTVDSPPSINAGNDTTICQGDSVNLKVLGGNNYLWNGPDLNFNNISNPKAHPLTSSNYIVQSTSLICVSRDTIKVMVDVKPNANAGPDSSVCPGNSITLQGSGTGQYAWSPSSSLNNSSVQNPVASPSVNTNYILTLTNGVCTSYDSVFISVLIPSGLNAGNDTSICFGDSASLFASGVSSYLWTPSSGLSNNQINNPKASPNTTQVYTVTYFSAGCSISDSITVTIKLLPSANAGKDSSFCLGDSIRLLASGGNQFLWQNSPGITDITVNNPWVKPGSAVNYIVKVTDNAGCSKNDSVLVSVIPKPIADAGPDESICTEKMVSLKASGGGKYLWNTGDTSSSISVMINKESFFTVRTFSGNCISDPDSVKVFFGKSTVKASFEGEPIKGRPALKVKFDNFSLAGDAYLWDFGDGTTSTEFKPAHTYIKRGKYRAVLTVFDKYGCMDTSSVEIEVLDEYSLSVPNVFTPNGDGNNDIFSIDYSGINWLKGFIYNRWGQKLYEWQMPEDPAWDGTHYGNKCPDGVYLYILMVNDSENGTRQVSGTITLLR